mmetsp:Transcript_5793/g.18431  ORF Transcript_5793/g.18431 Transcript_5793/m.18431 type:complete len:218 (-) Transcript_5793:894-1547(-)
MAASRGCICHPPRGHSRSVWGQGLRCLAGPWCNTEWLVAWLQQHVFGGNMDVTQWFSPPHDAQPPSLARLSTRPTVPSCDTIAPRSSQLIRHEVGQVKLLLRRRRLLAVPRLCGLQRWQRLQRQRGRTASGKSGQELGHGDRVVGAVVDSRARLALVQRHDGREPKVELQRFLQCRLRAPLDPREGEGVTATELGDILERVDVRVAAVLAAVQDVRQ